MKPMASIVLGAAIGSVATMLALRIFAPPPGTLSGAELESQEDSLLTGSNDTPQEHEVASMPVVSVEPDTAAPMEESSNPPNAPLELTIDRLLAENDAARGLHAAFMAQPQDPQLAFEKEDAWRQFYESKAEVHGYGVPQVSCGARFCEIRLLSKRPAERVKWAQLLLSPNESGRPAPPSQFVSSAEMLENGTTAVVFLVAHRK